MKRYEQITNEDISKYEWLIYLTQKKINYIDEDLAQVLRIALCKALATYNEDKGASIKTYITKVLANEAKFYIRTNSKFRRETPINLDMLKDTIDEYEEYDEYDEFVEHDNVKSLMNKGEFELLSLRFSALHTYKEIAVKLGTLDINEEDGTVIGRETMAVKRQIDKILKKIKKNNK